MRSGAKVDDAATFIRDLVPGYSFMASVLFEEPDPKRQSELMEGVHAAKEKELHAALWLEDPTGDEVAEAYSSGGPHAGDFLLPPLPGTSGDKVMMMPEDEFVAALRARQRDRPQGHRAHRHLPGLRRVPQLARPVQARARPHG